MHEDEFEEFQACSFSGGMLPTVKHDRTLEKHKAYKDEQHDEFEEFCARSYCGGVLPTVTHDRALTKNKALDENNDNMTTNAQGVSKSCTERMTKLHYSHDQFDKSSNSLYTDTHRVQDGHGEFTSKKPFAQDMFFAKCKQNIQDISCHSLDNLKEPNNVRHSHHCTTTDVKKACSNQCVPLLIQDNTMHSDQMRPAGTVNQLHELLKILTGNLVIIVLVCPACPPDGVGRTNGERTELLEWPENSE